MIAVKVLVEAIIVAWSILQEQRRRARLAGGMAALEERRMIVREAGVHTHPLVPKVGDRREARIERGPELIDQWRKRIGEIAIFAPAEAVARHHHMAAEDVARAIERGSFVAFGIAEQPGQHRPALTVELIMDLAP